MSVIRNERMMEILTNPAIARRERQTFLYELRNVHEDSDDEDSEDEDNDCSCESCTAERLLVARARASSGGDNRLLRIAYDEGREPLTEERARLLLTELRDVVISQGFFYDKVLRPWDFDPSIYENLDPDAVWWGWEFETGYNTPVDRSLVVEHVWDTWNGVTFDCEGNGNASEITFVPQEMFKFLDGTADACQFVEYLESQTDRTDPSGGPFVGTHINFSFPEFRDERGGVHEVVEGLNRSMLWMEDTAEFRTRYFGRDPFYGMFYAHHTWIEGKLFRTTYEYERFREYARVARAFTRIARAMLDKPNCQLICTNITDVIKDDNAPVILRAINTEIGLSHLPGRGISPSLSLGGEWRGRVTVEYAKQEIAKHFLPEVYSTGARI